MKVLVCAFFHDGIPVFDFYNFDVIFLFKIKAVVDDNLNNY